MFAYFWLKLLLGAVSAPECYWLLCLQADERAEELTLEARRDCIKLQHEGVRITGRRLILMRSGIMQTLIQYILVPGSKPDTINVWVMIVSAAFSNKVNETHKDGR